MKVFEASDFAGLLNLLPNASGNEAVRNQLMAMMAEQRVIRQPYTFEVDFSTGTGANLRAGAFAAPAPGANTPGNFLVDSSAPFMLVSSTYVADLVGVAQLSGTLIAPLATVMIADQSSNRNWMNVPVPVLSLFGTAQLPYLWPQPRLIPANTNVQVTLANYETANTNNVRLSFHGYRFYAVGQ